MNFSASVPLNSDSPGIFPAQNQTNMARLQTIISADHQFNLAATANDGYHNLIHMTLQAPSGALASTGRSYVKNSAGRVHEFYMDNTGAEYQITPTMPIRAAVNFTVGAGPGFAITINSQYNVSGVVRDSVGAYTVSFTTAMPNVNYIPQINGMRAVASAPVICSVLGAASYATSIDVGFLKIVFSSLTAGNVDPLMGSVTIFSVT